MIGQKELWKRIEIIVRIITSFMAVLMGGLFFMQFMRIYFGDQNPKYTYELLSSSIFALIIPIIISVVVVILGSFLLAGCHPRHFVSEPKERLRQLQKYELKEEDRKHLKYYENRLLISRIVLAIILFVCATMIILYMVQPKHFICSTSSQKLREDALTMCYYLLPWLIVSLVAGVFYEFYETKVINGEIRYINSHKKDCEMKEYQENKKAQTIIRVVQITVVVIAVGFIIYGIIDGEELDVLKKAANICTECIGLG